MLILLLFTACGEKTHFVTDDIVYLAVGDNGRYQLFTLDPDGRDPAPKQLTRQNQDILDFDISPGRFTAFTQTDDDVDTDIWLLWDTDPNPIPLAECGPTAACRTPRWSPTQNLFAYENVPIQEGEIVPLEAKLWWYDLEAFQSIPVFQDEDWLGQSARFSADGKVLAYLVPLIDEIQLFNLTTGEIGGISSRANVPVAWGAGEDLYFSALAVTHERTAIHIFRTDATGAEVVNLSGSELAVQDGGYALSPDGAQLAFTRKPPRGSVGRQIWLMDRDGGNQRSLTDDLSIQHGALSWNSAGTQLLYQRFELWSGDARPEIWLIDVESGEQRFIVEGTRPQFAP